MIKSHGAPIFQGFSSKRLCVINMSHKPVVRTNVKPQAAREDLRLPLRQMLKLMFQPLH